MKMRKRSIFLFVGMLAVILIVVSLLFLRESNKKNSQEETTGNEPSDVLPEYEAQSIEAMYITLGEDADIFIGQENGLVFSANFPKEIYDIDGNIITKDQLKKGNIVKIYGNGIMAESYPGQYNGVTKMEVIEVGSPSDADAYQDIIDTIYSEPDPAEPPMLSVQYTTDSAVVTAGANRGGYNWNYTDEEGISNAVDADSPHVLQWTEMVDLRLQKPTDLTLSFGKEPKEVKVFRWSLELRNTKEEPLPESEEVEAEYKEDKYVILGAESGYVYQVTATWENGHVDYGFLTVE